jgi:hypothetical protein
MLKLGGLVAALPPEEQCIAQAVLDGLIVKHRIFKAPDFYEFINATSLELAPDFCANPWSSQVRRRRRE